LSIKPNGLPVFIRPINLDKSCGVERNLYQFHQRQSLFVALGQCGIVFRSRKLTQLFDNRSYKSAFVLCHKLREAMAEEMKGRQIGDDRPEAEVDGAYFGGHVRPANRAEDRVDRRLVQNQSGKRQVVVVIRERGGETLPGVFKSEGAALAWVRRRVEKGTILRADEASSWNDLHARFEMKRINHQEAYSQNGACTNQAESYFSRLRRGEMGHHHHIAGHYLLRFAQEAAWREDNRRVSNGDQVKRVATLALGCKPSVDFCGYWQRHKADR
jgi:ISXO2-like transposase domain